MCGEYIIQFVMYVYIQGGNDPQTEADRRAQRCIVASLTTRFPGIRVEGEEVSPSASQHPN